jgi:hypothetical protein
MQFAVGSVQRFSRGILANSLRTLTYKKALEGEVRRLNTACVGHARTHSWCSYFTHTIGQDVPGALATGLLLSTDFHRWVRDPVLGFR